MLVVLLGPSCSGKSTFQKELVKDEGYHAVRTATTRPKRMGEDLSSCYFLKDHGRQEAISCVLRPSEDGDMVFLETNWSDLHPRQTESSSSPSEGSWSSWLDMLTLSQETLCPYSISVLMESPQSLVLSEEEMDDEITSGEWRQTRSTSDTSPRRTVSGSLRRITSWIASVIRRSGN